MKIREFFNIPGFSSEGCGQNLYYDPVTYLPICPIGKAMDLRGVNFKVELDYYIQHWMQDEAGIPLEVETVFFQNWDAGNSFDRCLSDAEAKEFLMAAEAEDSLMVAE